MSKTSPTSPMWGSTQPSSLNSRHHSASVETLWTININALEAERQQERGREDNRGDGGPRPTERVGGQTWVGSTGKREEEVWGVASGWSAGSFDWQ